MEQATSILMEHGLLGVIIFFLGYFAWSQRKDLKELNKQLVASKDLEIQRKEKDSEQYISIIEKSLNALTQVEKSMFENSIHIPVKIAETIKTAHEPLINEIRKVLEIKKNA